MEQGMSPAERAAFMAEPHVGVIAIEAAGRAPLTVPIWYAWHADGVLGFWMDGTSRKVRLLRQVGRLSFCVQRDARPYRYASVEATVLGITPIDWSAELTPLVSRYLDPEGARAYLEALGGPEGIAGDVYVRALPTHWRAEQL